MSLYIDVKGVCPYCNKGVLFSGVVPTDRGGTVIATVAYNITYENDKGLWAIGECPLCRMCVLIQMKYETVDIGLHSNKRRFFVDRIIPNPLPPPSDERIPEKIRKDIDEEGIPERQEREEGIPERHSDYRPDE